MTAGMEEIKLKRWAGFLATCLYVLQLPFLLGYTMVGGFSATILLVHAFEFNRFGWKNIGYPLFYWFVLAVTRIFLIPLVKKGEIFEAWLIFTLVALFPLIGFYRWLLRIGRQRLELETSQVPEPERATEDEGTVKD